MATDDSIRSVSTPPQEAPHALTELLRRAPAYLSDAAEVQALIARALSGQKEVKAAFTDEVRRLQKARALLIATQFAANHEVEFDASDAMAAIIVIVEQVLDGLDKTEVAL